MFLLIGLIVVITLVIVMDFAEFDNHEENKLGLHQNVSTFSVQATTVSKPVFPLEDLTRLGLVDGV